MLIHVKILMIPMIFGRKKKENYSLQFKERNLSKLLREKVPFRALTIR